MDANFFENGVKRFSFLITKGYVWGGPDQSHTLDLVFFEDKWRDREDLVGFSCYI